MVAVAKNYRVNLGCHTGDDLTGKERTYQQGSVVETTQNLLQLNGKNGEQPKFTLLEGDLPKQVTKYVDLAALSYEELVAFSVNEEIDLEEATDQPTALAEIRKALASR